MARQDGPIKGSIALVCNATAESTVVICEPIPTSTAQWAALVGGTAEVTCDTIVTDDLDHTYYDFVITTTGGETTTGARADGSIKGSLVFIDADDAINTEFIVEPLVLSEADYDDVLDGTKGIMATMYTDTLGHLFFEAEAI